MPDMESSDKLIGEKGASWRKKGVVQSREDAAPMEGVAMVWGRIGDWAAGVWEEEARLLEGAAECRRMEFAAARGLAHEAMRRLGVEEGAVLREGRAPKWPEGLVGALSHAAGMGGKEGWAVAAVGKSGIVRGIGIDLEWWGRVRPQLWGKVFNGEERKLLEEMEDGEWRQLAAGIGFSAKEAFFKLFHPLTGRWADFHEATVRVRRDGSFRLDCSAELPGIPAVLEGRWEVPEPVEAPGLVMCLLVYPRSGARLRRRVAGRSWAS